MFLLFISLNTQAKNESPFYLACHENNLNSDSLNTGFFTNKLPEIDKENQVTSFTLLNRLLGKINQKITSTEVLLKNILYCLENQSKEECEELNYWTYIEIPKYVKKTRYHAALAQSPHNLNTWRKKPEEEINEDLSIWSIHKIKDWDSLTNEETQKAENQLDEYKRLTLNKLDELTKTQELTKEQYTDFYNRTILDIRYRHYLKYQSLLGSVHLLQYISSDSPDIGNIYNALKDLNKNLEKEKKWVKRKTQEFNILYNTTMKTSNSILDLMSYRSLLEELLLEHPKYCNLAAAIMKYKGRRYIKQAVGIALPVMASSIFMPPLSGLALGFTTGAGFALHSQTKLNHQIRINMSKVYGDESEIEILEVSNTKKQRDFDVAIMPIGFGILSSASSKLGKGLLKTSAKASAEITKKTTQYADVLKIKKLQEKFSKRILYK